MPRRTGSRRRLNATWHADDHRSCFPISASICDRPLLLSPRATTTIARTIALSVIAAAVTASGAGPSGIATAIAAVAAVAVAVTGTAFLIGGLFDGLGCQIVDLIHHRSKLADGRDDGDRDECAEQAVLDRRCTGPIAGQRSQITRRIYAQQRIHSSHTNNTC